MPEPVTPPPASPGATAGTCSFQCEGCGDRVLAFGIERPPAHGLCSVCAWLCEEVPDPEEMMRLQRFLRFRPQPETREASPHGRLG